MRLALICGLSFLGALFSGVAQADLRPTSTNPIVFIESQIEGEEWAPNRVVEPQAPASFEIEGPGRLLLRMRTWAKDKDEAVAAILMDDRIVLTARIAAQLDKTARIVNESRQLSRDQLYLLWVEPGSHTVTVRYSAGDAIFVSSRYTKLSLEDWRAVKNAQLLVPSERAQAISSIGALSSDPEDRLRAGPVTRRRPKRVLPWFGRRPADGPAWDEIYLGQRTRPSPAPRAPSRALPIARSKVRIKAKALPHAEPAPRLLLEARAGVMLSQLMSRPGPVVGAEARIPVPELGAGSVGFAAELSHQSSPRQVSAFGVAVGLGHILHTAVRLGFGLQFELEKPVEWMAPYAGLGLGGLFGSIATDRDARRERRASYGVLGTLRVGTALGWGAPSDDKPFVELAVQGGGLFSQLLADNGGYFAGSLLVGYRFSLLNE